MSLLRTTIAAHDGDPMPFDAIDYSNDDDATAGCAVVDVHDSLHCQHSEANLDFVNFDYCCFRCSGSVLFVGWKAYACRAYRPYAMDDYDVDGSDSKLAPYYSNASDCLVRARFASLFAN